jgi:hypothetical protein
MNIFSEKRNSAPREDLELRQDEGSRQERKKKNPRHHLKKNL